MIEKDPEIFITVRKLATISLLEIYKDIIPEYRFRVSTETEKQQSVSIILSGNFSGLSFYNLQTYYSYRVWGEYQTKVLK